MAVEETREMHAERREEGGGRREEGGGIKQKKEHVKSPQILLSPQCVFHP